MNPYESLRIEHCWEKNSEINPQVESLRIRLVNPDLRVCQSGFVRIRDLRVRIFKDLLRTTVLRIRENWLIFFWKLAGFVIHNKRRIHSIQFPDMITATLYWTHSHPRFSTLLCDRKQIYHSSNWLNFSDPFSIFTPCMKTTSPKYWQWYLHYCQSPSQVR